MPLEGREKWLAAARRLAWGDRRGLVGAAVWWGTAGRNRPRGPGGRSGPRRRVREGGSHHLGLSHSTVKLHGRRHTYRPDTSTL